MALALRLMGFEVEDRDAAAPEETAKLEDLRVRDPEDPTWTNITEVKGYTKGGKLSDLLSLARFASAFRTGTGAEPTARWYVVNQWFQSDPDTRQVLLAGADADLHEFGLVGGLVIDTRDLFALVRAVEGDTLTAREARALLRSSTERFGFGA